MRFAALVLFLCSLPLAAQNPSPSTLPQTPGASGSKPCIIVKHAGHFSGRFFLTAAITPGSTYDLVDTIDMKGSKMRYKAKDLELLQAAGVKVVVVQIRYEQSELDAARESCKR